MHKLRNVLICDDSPVVHKAMAKYLSHYSELSLHYAEDGEQAIECLVNNQIDVLFLDLTMPVMDGFEVLQRLPVSKHETHVIVLSADVQKEAIERCLALGANSFLSKPFNQPQLATALSKVGVRFTPPQPAQVKTAVPSQGVKPAALAPSQYVASFKEVANIALGRGAAIISDHFGDFIKMPVPNVAMLSAAELVMAINDIKHQSEIVAIAQRFVGGGIHGEALICLQGKDIARFGHRLGFSQIDEYKNEVVIDIANLMVSSFLVSLSEQMNIPFSVRQPIVLEDYMAWGDIHCEKNDYFTVEYRYQAEVLDVQCDVLFMMDQNSTSVIKRIMETLH
ncbi:response regulator [Photobacterium sanctipauli]|uniref:Response regulator n=1 Tax=Photobacterium sanctipauli TaxID=1342794 RepID=A0A2T3NYT7_9GAMM|nr:response regulator [Photobacterium sanctipauli]PSW21437.1 response regulator [Photobacterium sanctipauli]